MGTGSNLDQKEKDVCRTIIMETSCNQQQTILSFYNNILNTVYLTTMCSFDLYDYCKTMLWLYILTAVMLAP